MKKLILVGLLLVSWVWGKSVEQVIEQLQSEWQQRAAAKTQEWQTEIQQNEDFMRLAPHCFQMNDKVACERLLDMYNKQCNNGSVGYCAAVADAYAKGNERMGIKADLKKAQSYADKVCTMDASLCMAMFILFIDRNGKFGLKYAEKACEMDELLACVATSGIYQNGLYGISKNPQKVKYYTDKLCKGGVSEACGK